MRFVHTGDLHLGMEPERGGSFSMERSKELWNTFERILDLCAQEKVDLLLIAGDLFHRQPTAAEIREVSYLLSKIGRTRVVLQAGNHDYLSSRSRLHELEQEDRVFLLPETEIASVLIPSCGTTVYGTSYASRTERENPLQGICPLRTRGYHILMAHGGDASHHPFDRRALAEAGFDYVALGHIHKPERFGERMAYCGSPEPLDHTETGVHGVILGELTAEGCHTELIPMAARQYRNLQVDFSFQEHGNMPMQAVVGSERKTDRPIIEVVSQTMRGLADELVAAIDREGAEDIYHIHLVGERDPEFVPDPTELAERIEEITANRAEGSIRLSGIVDESCPYYDMDALLAGNRDNLLGQFILRVRAMDGTEDFKKRVMAAGVQALLQGENEYRIK